MNAKRLFPLLIAIFLGLSWLVASGLNGFLGIRFSDKVLPQPPDYSAGRPDLQDPRGPRAPALQLRIVDEGAVGIVGDPADWGDDYKHNTRAFESVILADAPYVDAAEFARVERDFQAYVDRMRGMNYNGIVLRFFLELLDFSGVEAAPSEDGEARGVYAPDGVYLARHAALRASFGRMFRYAEERGMDVYLYTDMVALTPPLEDYLQRRFGRMNVHSREFWRVYRAGVEELFGHFPEVDGLMIRVGEAGAIYNARGWDYRSELLVRDRRALQLMLNELLPAFAADTGPDGRDRTLIFRTWSVGVGDVGDMHTNPETFERALGDVQSPNLVLSAKFVMGDFDSYLPLNPTLKNSKQRQIIEFQARREFEAFNAFPNYLGPLHQTALLEFLASNPNIDGAWLWTQSGGPLRAGPLSLYPFQGFWRMIDPNVYATARLLENPDADLLAVTEQWVRDNYGRDPQLVAALRDALLESHDIVQQGLYVAPYAEKQVLALGLEPPPMMWIFKWDIVSGSSSVLSSVYFTSREREDFERALAGGDAAVRRVQDLRASLESVRDRVDPEERESYAMLLRSLEYEADLFATLAAYRKTFLHFYRWIDLGQGEAWNDFVASRADFARAKTGHFNRYGVSVDFPAYNFFAAEAGLTHMDRTPFVIWTARLALLLFGALLLVGLFARSDALRKSRRVAWLEGVPGLRLWEALATGLLAPHRLKELDLSRRESALLAAVILGEGGFAMALFGSFAAWAFVLGVFGMQLSFAFALRFASRGLPWRLLQRPDPAAFADFSGSERRPGGGAAAAALAPFFAVALLFLAILAVRGPLYFWYGFWTDAGFRTGFVVVFGFLILWQLYAAYACGAAGSPRKAGADAGETGALPGLAAALAALGAGLLWLGLALGLPGLETALTVWNDQMAVLPLGLSRILGITTHLNIPLELPMKLGLFGGAMIATAIVLRLSHSGGRRATQAP